jgi:hypothetical protein
LGAPWLALNISLDPAFRRSTICGLVPACLIDQEMDRPRSRPRHLRRKEMKAAVFALCSLAGLSAVAVADIYTVTVTGEVLFNQIEDPPLGDVNSNDPVTLSFQVDSTIFLDSVMFPTRGYEIIQDSFALTMGAVTIGLQDPFPASETPYFVLRNDDPAVDGFLLASSPDVGQPDGVPLDQAGAFDQFRMVYATTYNNDPLPSLDIADAVGTYDFTGLTVFSMRIADGPVESAMEMDFQQMTIVPGPGALLLLLAGLAGPARRRM